MLGMFTFRGTSLKRERPSLNPSPSSNFAIWLVCAEQGKKVKKATHSGKVIRLKSANEAENKRSNRLNEDQKRAMVDYLKEHPHFAQGRIKGNNAAKKMEQMKKAMADKINAVPGEKRKPERWWKVCEMPISVLLPLFILLCELQSSSPHVQCWISLKCYAKNFAMGNYQPKDNRTGGGGPDDSVRSIDSVGSTDSTSHQGQIDVRITQLIVPNW